MKKYILCVVNFYKQHFALKMGIPLAIFILVLGIISQTYLKNQYYSFLYSEVYRADQVFLNTQETIISDRVYTMVRLGSAFATDNSFYQSLGEALQDNDNAVALYTVTEALWELSTFDSIISRMAIVSDAGDVFQYNRENQQSNICNLRNVENGEQLERVYMELQEKIEGKLAKRRGNCYVSMPVVETKNGIPRQLLHMAFPVLGRRTNFSKTQGVMIITYKMDMLDEFLSKSEYSYGFVTDEERNIIYHEDSTKIGMNADAYLKEIEGESLNIEMPQTGWWLYRVIDENALRTHVDEVYQKSIEVYIILLTLLIVFVLFIYKYTLQPIKMISVALNAVRDGELNQEIPVLGEDEICKLTMQYNQMINSLKEQQRRTEEAYNKNIENLRRANEAERKALESQINAHFLCNTLSVFNYNAIQAGNDELSVMLRSLSNILRYTFSGSFQEVTIVQEIMWTDQYLYLQKYRLGDVFDYEIEYSEEYDEWPCCKLFIQPFVENSIIHGFKGRQRGGLISIKCSLDEDRLRCVIYDNGCGIPKEKVEKLQHMLQGDAAMDCQGIGVGIQNVIARLQMFYGSRFEITLTSREGEGTQFILYFPIPDTMSEDEGADWL